MGGFGFLFFGEKDKVLIEEIAKLHNINPEKVSEAYKEMLLKLGVKLEKK